MADLETYELFKDEGVLKKTKGKSSGSKATYVDMKPDKAEKPAILHVLEDNWDTLSLLQENVRDPRMHITLKADMPNRCWLLSVRDAEVDYKHATYYQFRHASLSKVLALLIYTLTEKWQGFLPRTDILDRDIDW